MKPSAMMMLRAGKLFGILTLMFFVFVLQAGKAWAAPTYIDEASAQFTSTGTWTTITSHSEAYPTPGNFKESGTGAVTATWSMPATLATGNYEVWANWRTYTTYSTCVQFSVIHTGGTTSKQVNQRTPDTPPYFGAGNRSSDNFLGIFTLNEVITCLGCLTRIWEEGLCIYHSALSGYGERAELELSSAACAGRVFRSAWHVFQLYRLCRRWKGTVREKALYLNLCRAEAENCNALLPLLAADARLGLHLEHRKYLFNTDKVKEKKLYLEKYLREDL